MAGNLFDEIGAIVGGAIDNCGWADSALTKVVINQIVTSTRNRPHPWSTASDYTSWKSLTDRTYQGRHRKAVDLTVLPDPVRVRALFQRPDGKQLLSKKSTCLFPAFAQYLTDGFIRTNPDHREKTTSNHEIDLCPLYGLTETQTLALRACDETAGKRGRLKTQQINGEDFPQFFYEADGRWASATPSIRQVCSRSAATGPTRRLSPV
jgi:prostaglandin-endoperoxide synthase 2